jgi:hypothetical protein
VRHEGHASRLHGVIRANRQQPYIVVAFAGSLPVGFQEGIERTANIKRLRIMRNDNGYRLAIHFVLLAPLTMRFSTANMAEDGADPKRAAGVISHRGPAPIWRGRPIESMGSRHTVDG